MSIARSVFTASLLVLLVGGCAAHTSVSDVASEAMTAREALRLRMYEDPYAPFGRCDVGTDLAMSQITDARLNRAGAVGSVSLRESVPSGCEDVVPDPRTYELLYAGDDCGSAVFVASMMEDGRSRSLKITDHRGRACNDHVPAQMVVEEETASGDIRLLFARDPADVTCEIAGRRFGAGTSFRDGCNTCSCSPDGELACTLIACGEPGNGPL